MKIINAHSNTLNSGKALAPESGRLVNGEIGVNYSSQDPSLFIKDDAGNVVKFSSDNSLTGIFETVENKVTAYTEGLTDEQYPSAKLMFDVIKDNEEVISTALNDLNTRVTDIDTEIEDFGTRINTCETDIAEIKEDYAKKEDIPSLDDYYTKDDLTGTDGIITKNERVISRALNDLNGRIGNVETNYASRSEITKQFLLSILGGVEETLYFIDESGNTSSKKIIVLN